MDGSGEASVGEGCVVGSEAAGGDGHDSGEVGGGAGVLVGCGAGADDFAGHGVILRHDEAAEGEAGLLVPDAAVGGVLHGEHPIEVPLDFGEEVGEAAARLGDVEGEGVEGVREELPGPEEGGGGDAGVDGVAAIVAGIVPAAGVGGGSGAAGGGIEGVFEVAGGMLVAAAEIDRASAALAIEAAHGEAERVGVDVLVDGEGVGESPGDFEAVGAGDV